MIKLRYLSVFWLFLISFTGLTTYSASLHAAPLPSEDVQLSFDPKLEMVVLQNIAAGQSSIDLEMYKLTNRRVIRALQGAARHGVNVRVILCPSERENIFTAKMLLAAGISQLWYPLTKPNQIMHLKLAIFDQKRLLFGSVNWTLTGLNVNHEGIILIDKPEIVRQAKDQFEEDWRVSTQQVPSNLPSPLFRKEGEKH